MYIPGFFIPNPDIKIFVDEKGFTKEIYICCGGRYLLHEIQKSDIEYNPHAPQRRIGYTREGGVDEWLKKKRKEKYT
jgi:hypothetical protein